MISPLPFTLYVDKFMKTLEIYEEFTTIAYVDDITLIADTPVALQGAVDIE